jgi:hypothetical protein
MLMMLKEGGDLVLEAKGNTKLDEDLDLTLNEAGGAGISLSLRIVHEGLSVTSVTATQVRAIVLGDS